MNFDVSKLTTKNLKLGLPCYTLAEEIMNAITHGLGVIFSLVALVFLILKNTNNAWNIVYVSIYGASMLVLYLISTLYHALKPCVAKTVFRKLDHCCIFLLIAGTYTPLCAIYIKSRFSLVVLVAVWVTATIGIVLNAIDVNKFSKLSLACYIVMGWSVIFIIKPVAQSLDKVQMNYLIAGGTVYTVGAILYVIGKKVRYIHSIWHLFVLAGSILHFFVIYGGI